MAQAPETFEDSTIAQPEVLTLHWEGPQVSEPPPEHRFPQSEAEARSACDIALQRDFSALRRSRQGREIWQRIGLEAERRGDRTLWQRKLQAYWWVKMRSEGSAGDFAKRYDLNHATVRTWIADVAKLAYEVGYRLHEDRLALVGEAPPELQRLRELVNADAGSDEAAAELAVVAPVFRGEEPYFHLNEGHVLRAQGRLEASDLTLREGLSLAEAWPLRALLWNARGQTWWECKPGSSHPLRDYLGRAERAFRRAAVLDPSVFFPFVNLAQLAMDAGDEKRCAYWMGELSSARRKMSEAMQDDLARYLREAEWTRPVEERRFWRNGPSRWIREGFAKGVLVAAILVSLLSTLLVTPSTAESLAGLDPVAHDGGRGSKHSGAGGN